MLVQVNNGIHTIKPKRRLLLPLSMHKQTGGACTMPYQADLPQQQMLLVTVVPYSPSFYVQPSKQHGSLKLRHQMQLTRASCLCRQMVSTMLGPRSHADERRLRGEIPCRPSVGAKEHLPQVRKSCNALPQWHDDCRKVHAAIQQLTRAPALWLCRPLQHPA